MGRPAKTNLSPELKAILKIIGSNLRALREERGITQAKLSESSGVSLTTLNEIESKYHRDIRVSTLIALCKTLKVSIIELFLDSDLDISSSDRDQLLQASKVLNKLSRKISK